MASNHPVGGSPRTSSLGLPPALVSHVDQVTAHINRIVSILFEELHPLQRTPDDLKKFHQKISSLTFPFWPVLAPHRILPEKIVQHLVKIRQEWCFNDQMNLCSLWGADIYQNLSKLSKLPNRSIQKKEIEEIKKSFAAVHLLFNVIQMQETIRVVASQPIESSLYSLNRLKYNFPKLLVVKEKLVQILQREQQARNQFFSSKPRSKIASHNKTSLIEDQCNAIIIALDIGMALWQHPYFSQYMLRMPLRELSISANTPKDLTINVEQINCYIEMTRVGWSAVHEWEWLATIPNYMLELKEAPPFDREDDSASQSFTQSLRTALQTQESTHLMITQDYFKAAAGDFDWEEYARRTGLILNKEFIKVVTLEQWLAEAFSCLSLADQQMMHIHQLYENAICKPSNLNYFTFDELCNRLFQNFKKVFSKKNDPPSFPPATNGMERLLSRASDDLLTLRHAFERQVEGYLPEKQVNETVLKIIELYKDSCNYPPALASLFYPYRKAVIFTATKVPPAIEKGRHRFFKRIENSMNQLSLSELLEEREHLIERIESLCFSRMQPLVELFMTLRDIHAVLLEPKEATEGLEKGLHLIPKEIARLVHPTEIGQMIETLVQAKQKNSSVSLEKEDLSELIDNSDFGRSNSIEEEILPPLENNMDPLSLKLVEILKEAQHFEIGKGEKVRKIRDRLRRLGVYTLRSGKGSHFILAHPSTETTFTLPDHEILSTGVAKELEFWVRQIFSTPHPLLKS